MKWKILAFLNTFGFGVLAQGSSGESTGTNLPPAPGTTSTSTFNQIINSDLFSVLIGTAIVLGGYFLITKLKVDIGGKK